MIKTLTTNQNPSCFEELEHLKRQCMVIINRVGVDANIVIVIVIFVVNILGVSGSLKG